MLTDMLIATTNAGKMREFRDHLRELPLNLLSLKDIGFKGEIVEDGADFAANAWIKVDALRPLFSGPIVADDSGLTVEALGGEPGVYTARYAGPNATDAENWGLLLHNLSEEKDRRAAFHCALAVSIPGRPPLTFLGSCPGTILLSPQGDGGFGYDPIFMPQGRTLSFAQIPLEQKRALSHRGAALAQLQLHLRQHPC